MAQGPGSGVRVEIPFHVAEKQNGSQAEDQARLGCEQPGRADQGYPASCGGNRGVGARSALEETKPGSGQPVHVINAQPPLQ